MSLPDILAHLATLGNKVLECSIVGSVVALLFLGFHRWQGRKMRPLWLYGIGLLVLVRFLLIDVPESAWSWKNWTVETKSDPADSGSGIGAAASPQASREMGLADWRQMASQLGVQQQAEAIPLAQTKPAVLHVQVLAGIWAAGACGVILLALCRQFRFHVRLRRISRPLDDEVAPALQEVLESCRKMAGMRQRVEMRLMPGLGSPCVFGLWRPRLLLPLGFLDLIPDEWRHIFLHELAHVKGRDAMVNWIIVTAQALHWFNPVVWISLRQLLRDRELLRDAQAIHWLSSCGSSQDYGHTLLKLATQTTALPVSPGLASLFPTEKEIHRRITMITHPITKTSPGLRFCLTMTAIAGVALIAFTDASGQDEKPAAPTPPPPPISTTPDPVVPATALGAETSAAAAPDPLVETKSLTKSVPATPPALPQTLMPLEDKLRAITIEKVAFDQASIEEVTAYLRSKSKEVDPTGNKQAVNIILNLDRPTKAITMDLTNVPLGTLIEQVCLLTGCSFRVTDHAIIIESGPQDVFKNNPSDRIVELAKNLEQLNQEIQVREANPNFATEVGAMKSVLEKLTKEYYALRYSAAPDNSVSDADEIDAVIDAVVVAAKSPILEQLYLQFTSAKTELAGLEFDGHGPKHPKVLSTRAKVASLRKVLGERTKALIANEHRGGGSLQSGKLSGAQLKLESKKIELETLLQYDDSKDANAELKERRAKLVSDLIQVKQELIELGNAPPTIPQDKVPAAQKNETSASLNALPFGTPVVGKKGFVYSPYAPEKGMVDVSEIPAGTKVECPYTGKDFRIP